MKATVWRDFVGAVVEAARRPAAGRDAVVRADRARGVRRLATEVVSRSRKATGGRHRAA